jgi:predicted P-loop ATPase
MAEKPSNVYQIRQLTKCNKKLNHRMEQYKFMINNAIAANETQINKLRIEIKPKRETKAKVVSKSPPERLPSQDEPTIDCEPIIRFSEFL